MDQDAIIQYITDTFTGLDILLPTDGIGAGDSFFYYDPERKLDPAHRLPFTTIVVKDYNEYDNLSKLDRPGVYRLNIGVSRETFRALFGYAPGEPKPENAVYDYAALDTIMPHPLYEAQSYICVLNPSPETFERVKPLLAEAYALMTKRYASQKARAD